MTDAAPKTSGLPLTLEHISKSFDGVPVLRDVSYTGEVQALAIIGPSGGGKSTLLRILGGLLVPDGGRLVVNEQPVSFDEEHLRDYRCRLGFVFQDGGLFHHMTARQNIQVPLQVVHGYEEQAAAQRATELLERLGLLDQAEKRPGQLSGGQRQRVAIARALAASPDLLLLDEPTSALDPEYTTEVLDVVSELKKAGTRFIIVTHEMGFAARACDTVAFLYGGQLLECGSSRQIFDHPRTPELARFLGRLLEWSL